MLAIGRAIIEARKLIIVDEPSKGLAPAIVENLLEAFVALRAEGVSILMVEQNFTLARRLGDSVAVMDSGKIMHRGPMRDLAADDALQDALLGLDLRKRAQAAKA
jgi:branched-chain amino acid transport system ATP-binding protein